MAALSADTVSMNRSELAQKTVFLVADRDTNERKNNANGKQVVTLTGTRIPAYWADGRSDFSPALGSELNHGKNLTGVVFDNGIVAWSTAQNVRHPDLINGLEDEVEKSKPLVTFERHFDETDPKPYGRIDVFISNRSDVPQINNLVDFLRSSQVAADQKIAIKLPERDGNLIFFEGNLEKFAPLDISALPVVRVEEHFYKFRVGDTRIAINPKTLDIASAPGSDKEAAIKLGLEWLPVNKDKVAWEIHKIGDELYFSDGEDLERTVLSAIVLSEAGWPDDTKIGFSVGPNGRNDDRSYNLGEFIKLFTE